MRNPVNIEKVNFKPMNFTTALEKRLFLMLYCSQRELGKKLAVEQGKDWEKDHPMLLREARELVGIDHAEYLEMVRTVVYKSGTGN